MPTSGIIGHWVQQLILYSFLIFMAVIIYRRRLRWLLREFRADFLKDCGR